MPFRNSTKKISSTHYPFEIMSLNLISINRVLERSSQFLANRGVSSSKCDAEWIVSKVLNRSRMELYLNYGEILNEEKLDQIRKLVVARGRRVPLQHLLKTVDFAGLSLICDHRALIPRQETEQLVEILTQTISPSFGGNIMDLGTGSGAIIIALCHLLPNAQGFGLEKCKKAISLAKENVIQCKLDGRIELLEFDWNEGELPDIEVDLLVSNPPYLDQLEWITAEEEVKLHDPYDALVSENKGTSDLLRVIELASRKLNTGGILALEFGCNHADIAVAAMEGVFKVKICRDYSQRRRFSIAIKL
jgi:release factor glutamine methyltransferase